MKGAMFFILLMVSNCNVEPFTIGKGNEPVLPPDEREESFPAGYKKVYENSFEEVEKQDRHSLMWDMPHWIEYEAMHNEDGGKGDGLGGGDLWVEDSIAHSGRKSLGLELFDIEKSRRTELVIYPGDYIENEYLVSYWLYLPEGWGLYDPTINWDWFEIGNPFNSFGKPYAAIHISEPDENQETFTVYLSLREEKGSLRTLAEKRMTIPKGKWFNVRYYVLRHETDGILKLWFDNQFIGEQTGIQTKSSKTENFSISIAKIYHERTDKVPHQLWIDDLELYIKSRH